MNPCFNPSQATRTLCATRFRCVPLRQPHATSRQPYAPPRNLSLASPCAPQRTSTLVHLVTHKATLCTTCPLCFRWGALGDVGRGGRGHEGWTGRGGAGGAFVHGSPFTGPMSRGRNRSANYLPPAPHRSILTPILTHMHPVITIANLTRGPWGYTPSLIRPKVPSTPPRYLFTFHTSPLHYPTCPQFFHQTRLRMLSVVA